MRSRYNLMPNFSTKNSDNDTYKDIYNLPLSKFEFTTNPNNYIVTEADRDRLDLLMFKVYETTEWDDLILWINGISSVYDLEIGQEILLPMEVDIQNFYNKYLVG